MESTPVGKRQDCNVIMLGESEHHSRSTIEIDVEQIAFCVGCELRNGRYSWRSYGRKQRQNGCAAAAVFTTFYNHLRCLDTLAQRGLYSLTLVRVSEQSGEAGNVQEVEIDRTHKNAPDVGAGHRAPCSSADGLQHLEPETYPAR